MQSAPFARLAASLLLALGSSGCQKSRAPASDTKVTDVLLANHRDAARMVAEANARPRTQAPDEAHVEAWIEQARARVTLVLHATASGEGTVPERVRIRIAESLSRDADRLTMNEPQRRALLLQRLGTLACGEDELAKVLELVHRRLTPDERDPCPRREHGADDHG